MGFTAVNTRQSAPTETVAESSPKPATKAAHPLFSKANTDNVTVLNGASIKGISQEQRVELIKSFLVNADIQARDDDLNRRSSIATTRSATLQTPQPPTAESLGNASLYASNITSAVPIPSTPASLLPHLKPTQMERDDGGPYKAEMVNRMESLHRGERILPPCDRCRRLHMDCLKNLTACMGCTKKHAKCSWKDVREEELRTNRTSIRTASYSPEHVVLSDQGELDSPEASLSSHNSPTSAVRPTALEPPPNTSRRELDLLPPPSSLATSLTTSIASPSIYASIEKRSDLIPPLTSTSSAPRISIPQNPDHLRLTNNTPTSAAPGTTVTIGQQLQDAANGLAAAHRCILTPHRPSQNQSQSYNQSQNQGIGRDITHNRDDDDDDDEEENVDRLQALAAQVYRSASTQQSRA